MLKEIVSSGFGKLIQKRRFVFVTLLIWVNAQQLLQGNIPLNHLLKEETAVKVVNDLTFSVDSYLFALNLPFFFLPTNIYIVSKYNMHVFNYRITTDYDLNLKWYDPRLIFRNLKPDETFNDLGKPKCVLNKDLLIMASMIN